MVEIKINPSILDFIHAQDKKFTILMIVMIMIFSSFISCYRKIKEIESSIYERDPLYLFDGEHKLDISGIHILKCLIK